jgi:hypothetical protein
MFATKRRWLSLFAPAALLLLTPLFMAADNHKAPSKGAQNPDNETVEMFQAMKDGQISVKFIPNNAKQANVLIENKTDKPLNVKLPDAFVGVPVLPQFGGGGFGGGGNRSGGGYGGGGNGGGNQSMGGGMGGMGMGGMGMGMFNVPAEKVGKIQVDTVCLEHGKADPRPRVPYEIKPVESFTTKAGVKELCQMLGNRQIDQRSAQAAAWHLSNDMSWHDLSSKQLRYANGARRPYFSQQEIQTAMAAAGTAVRTAAENEKQKPSPGENKDKDAETATRQ